jgi:hypothetical protein
MNAFPTCRRNPDVSWRAIEGQAVLIHNRLGEIQVLNDLGTYIWENLDMGPEELARNISERFEVSPQDAEKDVIEFIETLRASGALEHGQQ